MAEKRKDTKGRILRDREYQQADGRYYYRYYDHKNTLRTVYSWRLVETDNAPVGKKKTDALRTLEKQIERDLSDGIDTKIKKITLDAYWEDNIALRKLKQSTRTNYKYMYSKYIQPELGHLKIDKINYSLMRRFMDSLIREKGFKPNSVEIIYTILHPVFTMAVRDNLLRTNPMDGVMTEIKNGHDWTKNKRHALTEKEQEAFVNYLANSDTYNHWLPLFTALLGTGCRIGEMLGLRWEDIDFKNNLININHNLIYRVQDSGNCEYHITTPKTKAGTRIIPMFSQVRKAILTERMRQMQNGSFCKNEIDGYSGFIWSNRYGEILNPHCINRAIVRIIRDYNAEETELANKEKREALLLPHFSCHHLRHTFCTRFCENETDLKLIQEIMGHADISTTMDIYNESNTERKKASFERLEGKIKIC